MVAELENQDEFNFLKKYNIKYIWEKRLEQNVKLAEGQGKN